MADFKTLFGMAGVRAADPPRSADLRSCCIWRDVDTGRLSGGVPVTAKPRTRTGPRADCISLPVHWGIRPIGTLTSSIGETAPLDEPD
jgi:hypothetical protein